MQSLLFAILALFSLVNAQTVVDFIDAAGDLADLEAAIPAGATRTLLDDAGETFTVLAPIDDADFTNADLGFHIIDGQALEASDLDNGQLIPSADTLSDADSFIRVFKVGENVYFCSENCAIVTSADNDATNGIVHKIDEILEPAKNLNIGELAADTVALSTLLDLVELSPDVLAAVSDETDNALTLFAPSNDAFDKIPAKWALCLQDPESTAALTDILLYHVVDGVVPSFALSEGDVDTLLVGESVEVTFGEADSVFINNAEVVIPNVFANNGVVHVIDAVLLPPEYDADWFAENCDTVWDFIQGSPDLDTLQTAIDAAGLDDDLDTVLRGDAKYTLFAPSDEALADFTGTPDLAFHLLAGGKVFSEDLENEQTITNGNSFIHVFIDAPGDSLDDFWFCSSNCAQPVSVDNEQINGVTHIIDSVLVPAVDRTITDIIVASTTHVTLESALVLTSLAGVFDVDDTFTVFAPTDDAFEATFTEDELDCLTDGDHNTALADILRSHVVSSVVPSFLLSSGEVQTIVTGRTVTVTVSNTAVTVEGATVSSADIFANNGVVHVINRVIRPETYDEEWFAEQCSGASSVVLGLFSILGVVVLLL